MAYKKKFAWSHSALNSFETCAFKHFMTRVSKKIKEPQTPAQQEGLEVHKRLEDRLKSGIPLQGMMAEYEPFCKKIEQAAGEIFPESSVALTDQFKKCSPTDWDNAWFRNVIDVLKINKNKAWVGDWKTGKVDNSKTDQLDLSALTVFVVFPEVQTINANFIWLKDKSLSPTQTYTRDMVNDIWARFLPRVIKFKEAFDADIWPTTQSGLCRNHCIVNTVGQCPEFKK